MNSDILLTWVRDVLTTTPNRWSDLILTLPIELLTRPPAASEWSAVECLQHIIDTETIFNARLASFAQGRDLSVFNPDDEGTKLVNPTPAEMVADFKSKRAKSLEALNLLTPDLLSRTARHPELGTVSLGEMIHEWAAHDFNHTIQAERAMMQPFIHGCGPWQKYFQDNIVQ